MGRFPILLVFAASFGLSACDDGSPALDAGVDTGVDVDPAFIASCNYTNSFAMGPECREYSGAAGWTATTAADDCTRVFLRMPGELVLDAPCAVPNEVGRCIVGDLEDGGYLTVSSGDLANCGAAQTGCETFAGGTFMASPECNACVPSGTEPPGAIVPTTPTCTEALPGEPTGASDGLVCTRSLISASTEPGRRFADYGDCDVVRSQRPYYAMPSPAEFDPEDTRLDNATYMDELAWLREEIEASACVCCHAESSTPEGAAYWDIEAGPLWIDTVSDEALAMITGLTDSSAFGYLEMADNNGLDRSQTGIPTTDRERLQAFAALEFERRGITMEQAAELPPFAPFFQELIDHEPEACDEGIGVDASGTLQWTGGGARYLWVLEEGSDSPGVPPNWDLPEGTIWALSVDSDAAPLGCGMQYGEVPAGAVQRVPSDGAAPELTSGTTYYLAVMRDIAQPITRCLFTAP